MSITEERQKEVDFSVEYATSRQVIITLKDSKIKKPEDIKGKKVAVQLGTVADLVLTEDYDVELTRQKKFLAAIEDVKAKKVDCVVMDYLPAKELLKENNELVILEEELFTDKYAVAVKKGNKELLDQINKVLQRLIDEGKIEEYTINYSK
jgi:polar amino acid transport system substrate-binding protein